MLTMNEIAIRCKKVLKDHYGEQFGGLILHGSHARDQAKLSSDIDLLVLLNKPFNYFEELRRVTDMLYPIQLESAQLISAKPAAVDEFKDGSLQLYRNARSEGLAL